MRLLSMSQLGSEKGIPYSRPHIYRLIKAGSIPRPVHLGPNRIAFVESEIDAWLAERIAERDDPDRLKAELAEAQSALQDLLERAELARERSHPGPRPAEIRRAERRVAAAQKAVDAVGKAACPPDEGGSQ